MAVRISFHKFPSSVNISDEIKAALLSTIPSSISRSPVSLLKLQAIFSAK
jgi:hypothetical protein